MSKFIARLGNGQCVFDSLETDDISIIRNWALDRGSKEYGLTIEDTAIDCITCYTIKNNRIIFTQVL